MYAIAIFNELFKKKKIKKCVAKDNFEGCKIISIKKCIEMFWERSSCNTVV